MVREHGDDAVDDEGIAMEAEHGGICAGKILLGPDFKKFGIESNVCIRPLRVTQDIFLSYVRVRNILSGIVDHIPRRSHELA